MIELKRCPCGETPEFLRTEDTGQGGKWMAVYGACCGEWRIEFRTQYFKQGSKEFSRLAVEAWNEAPRSSQNKS